MVELEIKSEEKLHEESLKKFLAGKIGKAYGKEMLDHLLAVMKENGASNIEMAARFFNRNMEFEDGDVEVIASLKLKKIGEED